MVLERYPLGKNILKGLSPQAVSFLENIDLFTINERKGCMFDDIKKGINEAPQK